MTAVDFILSLLVSCEEGGPVNMGRSVPESSNLLFKRFISIKINFLEYLSDDK